MPVGAVAATDSPAGLSSACFVAAAAPCFAAAAAVPGPGPGPGPALHAESGVCESGRARERGRGSVDVFLHGGSVGIDGSVVVM